MGDKCKKDKDKMGQQKQSKHDKKSKKKQDKKQKKSCNRKHSINCTLPDFTTYGKGKQVRKVICGAGMWSAGYFVRTTGLDEKMIKRYIQYQEKEGLGQAQLVSYNREAIFPY